MRLLVHDNVERTWFFINIVRVGVFQKSIAISMHAQGHIAIAIQRELERTNHDIFIIIINIIINQYMRCRRDLSK